MSAIQAPRGTADVLPGESYRWQYVEQTLRAVCGRFGYREIRIPTFEHTELFRRGVGETTDVVGKEMYTMEDLQGRSITLRPEGTAGVVRSMIQHGVLKEALPARAYYILSCFRYEKPQAGRYREFHQLGIELFGVAAPDADAEVIKVAKTALEALGIRRTRLEINTIGCAACRARYHDALRDYFRAHLHTLCETCNQRMARNPLRILDCKSEVCRSVAKDAPDIFAYICGDCAEHFGELQSQLREADIPYTVNPRIVRGLDYYSRTVFEFIHEGAGAQGTVCGGGRYDRLAEYLGGDPCPGIGFGMGLERILLVMESENAGIPVPPGADVFLAFVGDAAKSEVRRLVYLLQKAGWQALYDIQGRSLKAQLKYADKVGALRAVIIGDGEMASGRAKLRDMQSGTETDIPIDVSAIAAALVDTSRDSGNEGGQGNG